MTSESRMFSVVTRTWNPVTGCPHNCTYCWARKMATTRLRHLERYRDGFVSRLNEEEFREKFNGGFIFVSSMGDLFAYTVPDGWIIRVIEHVKKFPEATFLFLTKNPARYLNFDFPENAILGATIETDRDEIARRLSRAPLPSARIEAMAKVRGRKFVSVEPILNFTDSFPEKIERIGPAMVYVGYDNYNNRLPEPSLERTKKLISELSRFTAVHEKTIRRAWWEQL